MVEWSFSPFFFQYFFMLYQYESSHGLRMVLCRSLKKAKRGNKDTTTWHEKGNNSIFHFVM